MPGAGRAGPERTCVGCRDTGPQRSLIRIAPAPATAGSASGWAPGRGAYVHRDRACAERALRPAVLARALRRGLGPDELGRLRERIERELGGA